MKNYKSFMDKQLPPEDLIADTVSKAKAFMEDKEAAENFVDVESVKDADGAGSARGKKWRYGIAVFITFCMVAGGIWQWNMRVEYVDLVNDFVPDNESSYLKKREDIFGEERNSYLSFDPTYFYVFDKEAEISEVSVGQGKITVQSGTVKLAGNQLLYQITPQKIKGKEVFLGRIGENGEERLYAAFDLGKTHYYLEGNNVEEREMTEYIRKFIQNDK